MSLGTGAFQVVRRLGIPESMLEPKGTVFEESWKRAEGQRRRRMAENSNRGRGMGAFETGRVAVAAM